MADTGTSKITLTLAALLAVTACASNGPKGPPKQARGGEAVNQPRMLLSFAREELSKKGCAGALPAYRVVAGFGAGYEPAHYELGDCLLEVAQSGSPDAALSRSEGLIWIKRAALAGNARAQHRLAELLSGVDGYTADGISPDPEAALGWAKVYAENPARSLYALPDVSPIVRDHLEATLSAEAINAANAFAADFETVALASFTPPTPQRGGRDASRQRPQGGQGGQRRRRVADAGN